jgi:hypothetical protein
MAAAAALAIGTIATAVLASRSANKATSAQKRANDQALAREREIEATEAKELLQGRKDRQTAWLSWYRRYGKAGLNRYGMPSADLGLEVMADGTVKVSDLMAGPQQPVPTAPRRPQAAPPITLGALGAPGVPGAGAPGVASGVPGAGVVPVDARKPRLTLGGTLSADPRSVAGPYRETAMASEPETETVPGITTETDKAIARFGMVHRPRRMLGGLLGPGA